MGFEGHIFLFRLDSLINKEKKFEKKKDGGQLFLREYTEKSGLHAYDVADCSWLSYGHLPARKILLITGMIGFHRATILVEPMAGVLSFIFLACISRLIILHNYMLISLYWGFISTITFVTRLIS